MAKKEMRLSPVSSKLIEMRNARNIRNNSGRGPYDQNLAQNLTKDQTNGVNFNKYPIHRNLRTLAKEDRAATHL